MLLKRKSVFNKLENEQKKVDKVKEGFERKLDDLGLPKQRGDRNYRKQSIMIFRTLLLENLLISFFAILLPSLTQNISIYLLIDIFFKRSGSVAETPSLIYYLVIVKFFRGVNL